MPGRPHSYSSNFQSEGRVRTEKKGNQREQPNTINHAHFSQIHPQNFQFYQEYKPSSNYPSQGYTKTVTTTQQVNPEVQYTFSKPHANQMYSQISVHRPAQKAQNRQAQYSASPEGSTQIDDLGYSQRHIDTRMLNIKEQNQRSRQKNIIPPQISKTQPTMSTQELRQSHTTNDLLNKNTGQKRMMGEKRGSMFKNYAPVLKQRGQQQIPSSVTQELEQEEPCDRNQLMEKIINLREKYSVKNIPTKSFQSQNQGRKTSNQKSHRKAQQQQRLDNQVQRSQNFSPEVVQLSLNSPDSSLNRDIQEPAPAKNKTVSQVRSQNSLRNAHSPYQDPHSYNSQSQHKGSAKQTSQSSGRKQDSQRSQDSITREFQKGIGKIQHSVYQYGPQNECILCQFQKQNSGRNMSQSRENKRYLERVCDSPTLSDELEREPQIIPRHQSNKNKLNINKRYFEEDISNQQGLRPNTQLNFKEKKLEVQKNQIPHTDRIQQPQAPIQTSKPQKGQESIKNPMMSIDTHYQRQRSQELKNNIMTPEQKMNEHGFSFDSQEKSKQDMVRIKTTPREQPRQRMNNSVYLRRPDWETRSIGNRSFCKSEMNRSYMQENSFLNYSSFGDNQKGYSFSRSFVRQPECINPGPGSYKIQDDFTRPKSLQFRIGNSQRSENLLKRTPEKLGPGFYEAQVLLKNKALQFTSRNNMSHHTNSLTPGPGAYDTKVDNSDTVSISMGTGQRSDIVRNPHIPGPGAYQGSQSALDHKGYSFGRSIEKQMSPQNPGPGSYFNEQNSMSHQTNGPSVIISQTQRKDIADGQQSQLGPGQYKVETTTFNKQGYSFPKYNPSPKGPNAPGPGQYHYHEEIQKPSSHQYSIGHGQRSQNVLKHTPEALGPGYYQTIPEVPVKGHQFSKTRSQEKVKETPGPGYYDTLKDSKKTEGVSFGQTEREGIVNKNSAKIPGPGHYDKMQPIMKIKQFSFNHSNESDEKQNKRSKSKPEVQLKQKQQYGPINQADQLNLQYLAQDKTRHKSVTPNPPASNTQQPTSQPKRKNQTQTQSPHEQEQTLQYSDEPIEFQRTKYQKQAQRAPKQPTNKEREPVLTTHTRKISGDKSSHSSHNHQKHIDPRTYYPQQPTQEWIYLQKPNQKTQYQLQGPFITQENTENLRKIRKTPSFTKSPTKSNQDEAEELQNPIQVYGEAIINTVSHIYDLEKLRVANMGLSSNNSSFSPDRSQYSNNSSRACCVRCLKNQKDNYILNNMAEDESFSRPSTQRELPLREQYKSREGSDQSKKKEKERQKELKPMEEEYVWENSQRRRLPNIELEEIKEEDSNRRKQFLKKYEDKTKKPKVFPYQNAFSEKDKKKQLDDCKKKLLANRIQNPKSLVESKSQSSLSEKEPAYVSAKYNFQDLNSGESSSQGQLSIQSKEKPRISSKNSKGSHQSSNSRKQKATLKKSTTTLSQKQLKPTQMRDFIPTQTYQTHNRRVPNHQQQTKQYAPPEQYQYRMHQYPQNQQQFLTQPIKAQPVLDSDQYIAPITSKKVESVRQTKAPQQVNESNHQKPMMGDRQELNDEQLQEQRGNDSDQLSQKEHRYMIVQILRERRQKDRRTKSMPEMNVQSDSGSSINGSQNDYGYMPQQNESKQSYNNKDINSVQKQGGHQKKGSQLFGTANKGSGKQEQIKSPEIQEKTQQLDDPVLETRIRQPPQYFTQQRHSQIQHKLKEDPKLTIDTKNVGERKQSSNSSTPILPSPFKSDPSINNIVSMYKDTGKFTNYQSVLSKKPTTTTSNLDPDVVRTLSQERKAANIQPQPYIKPFEYIPEDRIEELTALQFEEQIQPKPVNRVSYNKYTQQKQNQQSKRNSEERGNSNSLERQGINNLILPTKSFKASQEENNQRLEKIISGNMLTNQNKYAQTYQQPQVNQSRREQIEREEEQRTIKEEEREKIRKKEEKKEEINMEEVLKEEDMEEKKQSRRQQINQQLSRIIDMEEKNKKHTPNKQVEILSLDLDSSESSDNEVRAEIENLKRQIANDLSLPNRYGNSAPSYNDTQDHDNQAQDHDKNYQNSSSPLGRLSPGRRDPLMKSYKSQIFTMMNSNLDIIEEDPEIGQDINNQSKDQILRQKQEQLQRVGGSPQNQIYQQRQTYSPLKLYKVQNSENSHRKYQNDKNTSERQTDPDYKQKYFQRNRRSEGALQGHQSPIQAQRDKALMKLRQQYFNDSIDNSGTGQKESYGSPQNQRVEKQNQKINSIEKQKNPPTTNTTQQLENSQDNKTPRSYMQRVQNKQTGRMLQGKNGDTQAQFSQSQKIPTTQVEGVVESNEDPHAIQEYQLVEKAQLGKSKTLGRSHQDRHVTPQRRMMYSNRNQLHHSNSSPYKSFQIQMTPQQTSSGFFEITLQQPQPRQTQPVQLEKVVKLQQTPQATLPRPVGSQTRNGAQISKSNSLKGHETTTKTLPQKYVTLEVQTRTVAHPNLERLVRSFSKENSSERGVQNNLQGRRASEQQTMKKSGTFSQNMFSPQREGAHQKKDSVSSNKVANPFDDDYYKELRKLNEDLKQLKMIKTKGSQGEKKVAHFRRPVDDDEDDIGRSVSQLDKEEDKLNE